LAYFKAGGCGILEETWKKQNPSEHRYVRSATMKRRRRQLCVRAMQMTVTTFWFVGKNCLVT
jgi:hypothetical protein